MYIIATFRSRTQTMTFKQILLSYKVFSDIINTPRQASVSCGISVRFDSKFLSVAKDILSRRKFDSFVGFFSVQEEQNVIVRPIY